MAITLPVLIFCFKETNGMSLEEIDLMFGDRALGNLPSDIEKTGIKIEKEGATHQEETNKTD